MATPGHLVREAFRALERAPFSMLQEMITGDDVMARKPATFKQADVTRAVRGVVAAGVDVTCIEIDARTGNIVISPRVHSPSITPYDAWKADGNAR
jgi:hypothetical protein